MKLEEICRHTFTYFFEKVYKISCPPGIIDAPRAKDAMDNFGEIIKKKYGKSAGPAYIYDYVLYQYGRYWTKAVDNSLGGPTGKITPIMVFGMKSLQFYEKRNLKMEFMLQNSPLISVCGVSKAELSFKKGIRYQEIVKRGKYRDTVKAIASVSDNPLQTCLDMTDLFDDQDPACQRCPMKDRCKITLKKTYPNIYKRRNYE